MKKKEVIEKRRERLDELKAATIVHPDSCFDVINEGIGHVIENLEIQKEPQFAKDYVFLMGKAYLGTAIKSPCEDVRTVCVFCDGDLHEFSHDLAELMKHDQQIASFIFHAVQMYGARP